MEPEQGQEICLFVHYDASNEIQDNVIDYLDALKRQGVCVLFLSNSETLSQTAVSRLQGRVWRLINTRNRAYDWGLYFIGVKLVEGRYVKSPLILANDSVIAVNDLSQLFNVARSPGAQITGAIDGWQHDWHLQSFFLYVAADTVQGKVWKDFWRNYRHFHSKWLVINGNEYGFSRWMKRNGVSVRAAWKYNDLVKRPESKERSGWRRNILETNQLTNPTVEMWDVLLDMDFPFLKRWIFNNALLSGNLSHLSNVISGLAVKSLRNGAEEATSQFAGAERTTVLAPPSR